MFETKRIARKKAIEARQAAHETELNAGEALASNFDIQTSPNGLIIAGYMPMDSEIDPIALMRKLQTQGAILALPRVNKKKQMLDFHIYDFGDLLEQSAFGIREPLESSPIIEPDWLLVPLLAYDKYGRRLGYGGGFYDKAIFQLKANKKIKTIGIAYSAQEVEAVPHEAHDEPLDWIVTNKGARHAKSATTKI